MTTDRIAQLLMDGEDPEQLALEFGQDQVESAIEVLEDNI